MNKPSEHWLYVSVVVTVSDISGYSITTCNFAEGQLHVSKSNACMSF